MTERMASSTGIASITIEHQGCYGTCPVYTATIYHDGTIRYKGEAFVEQTGKHQGRVDPEAVETLERWIEKIGFESLEDDYPAPMTDQEGVVVTVVAHGKRKSVRAEGGFGPEVLGELQERIDQLLLEARWGENGETWTKIGSGHF